MIFIIFVKKLTKLFFINSRDNDIRFILPNTLTDLYWFLIDFKSWIKLKQRIKKKQKWKLKTDERVGVFGCGGSIMKN